MTLKTKNPSRLSSRRVCVVCLLLYNAARPCEIFFALTVVITALAIVANISKIPIKVSFNVSIIHLFMSEVNKNLFFYFCRTKWTTCQYRQIRLFCLPFGTLRLVINCRVYRSVVIIIYTQNSKDNSASNSPVKSISYLPIFCFPYERYVPGASQYAQHICSVTHWSTSL